MKTTKISIKLKPIKNGRSSIYLDYGKNIYRNPKSKKLVRKEYLGQFYFDKPKNKIEREHNKETNFFVEKIRTSRQNEINKSELYNGLEEERDRIKKLGEQCFLKYYLMQANRRSGNTYSNWMSAYKYLKKYADSDTLKFSELNVSFLEGFKVYLLSTHSNKDKTAKLSQNTAVAYFTKVKAAIKAAQKEDYIQNNLNEKVSHIKEIETKREYLNLEEVNELIKTPCKKPILKRVSLFAILTGFASAEIRKIIWADVSLEKDVYKVYYRRQKSLRDNYVYISRQAYDLMGGTQNPKDMPQEEKVFKDYNKSSNHDKILAQWIKDAKITKKITFHNFRHTYATLQLSEGTDIYTVSKILGHKNLKTTEIYAKVVDKSKREAINKIVLNFDDYENQKRTNTY